MIDRFDICWPYTLIQECPHPEDWSNHKNFSNDRHDPGGATMCGIIQREYDLWRKGHSLPTQPVELITRDEGQAIYRIGYWLPHCPSLGAGLDLSFFDAAVNMGQTEAIRILQHALGVTNDGVWGEHTAAAVRDANRNPAAAITNFTSRRQWVYEHMRGFSWFGDDWTRRTHEIGQQSLRMTAGAVS